MKLGIAGAGLIVSTLLEFVHETPIGLIAICARPGSLEKLNDLKEKHGFKRVYTDYEEMLKDEEIDTIYIGVNNHLHYSFAKRALECGKNVIQEKPFTSNAKQAAKLISLAKDKRLFLFEAISTIHNPNFKKIESLIPFLGDIKIVTLNYTQYSSRYDAFQRGEILPAFDRSMSGGALMDLNIYNIHFIVKLFGSPKSVSYIANMEQGIDTSGILTLDYDDQKAVLIGAKDCKAPYICAIQGNKGSISTDSPMYLLTHFDLELNKEDRIRHDETKGEHRMKHEFDEFLRIVDEKDYEECYGLLDHSLKVMEVVTKARECIGLQFPDDENI